MNNDSWAIINFCEFGAVMNGTAEKNNGVE